VKKVNVIGKVIMGIGVLHLFRKVHGNSGFGGYIDNTWEIIFGSLIIIAAGALLVLISRKAANKNV
jgi:hypothetical protein